MKSRYRTAPVATIFKATLRFEDLSRPASHQDLLVIVCKLRIHEHAHGFLRASDDCHRIPTHLQQREQLEEGYAKRKKYRVNHAWELALIPQAFADRECRKLTVSRSLVFRGDSNRID